MTFPSANRGAEKLLALGPIGFLFALMLGHGGHLSTIPLLIGGFGGLLGFMFRLIRNRTKEEAL